MGCARAAKGDVRRLCLQEFVLAFLILLEEDMGITLPAQMMVQGQVTRRTQWAVAIPTITNTTLRCTNPHLLNTTCQKSAINEGYVLYRQIHVPCSLWRRHR